MGDLFDLERFVNAQDEVYEAVQTELARGKKTSHWMWFVFPQLKGLGFSSTAQHFGIASRAEAHAYWIHPVLGPRLKECTELVLAVQGKTAREIFGTPDDLKFRSSMTLFAAAAPEEEVFQKALEEYYYLVLGQCWRRIDYRCHGFGRALFAPFERRCSQACTSSAR